MLRIKHNFCPTKSRISFVALLLFISGVISGVALFCPGCSEATDKKAEYNRPTGEEFNNYWFQGLAEISRFDLEQARYGEIHKGDAVLIYVTEEFFTDKQVKSELGKQPGAVPVLKLNFVRNFITGIYPYSMMSSIFTPVNRRQHPQSLKVTTSIQEWCGQ
ncbi:MAG: septum formation inhibitor Maf, partial [Deltaproteobacteria bacterium]|nr:septum formation inhibitor Maf [Deltaproteobacteria bacterium]